MSLLNITNKHTKNILLGKVDGVDTYLAAPSWDCGWYWGFGYIQNKYLHMHCNSLDINKNMRDAIKEFFDAGTLTLSDEDLWTFCELMKTFYTLKETAELYYRGGANYTRNPLQEKLKNKKEFDRINGELLPEIFDEIYKLEYIRE